MDRNLTRVLVVDDDPLMRRLVTRVLRELGFASIDQAVDGLAAITEFQHAAYELVITDWNMPNATGIDLLRAIRGGSERTQTPVLVLTGHVNSERVQEAIGAGATGFVAKPFEVSGLCQKVLGALGLLNPVTEPAYEARFFGR